MERTGVREQVRRSTNPHETLLVPISCDFVDRSRCEKNNTKPI
jgi:hypothetical protein